jgi:hypothetical protein
MYPFSLDARGTQARHDNAPSFAFELRARLTSTGDCPRCSPIRIDRDAPASGDFGERKLQKIDTLNANEDDGTRE